MKIITIIFGSLACLMMPACFTSGQSYATISTSSSIYEKALRQGVFDCYTKYKAFNSPVSIGDSWVSTTLINSIGEVPLPNGTNANATLNCNEFFFGKTDRKKPFVGVLPSNNIGTNVTGNITAASNLLSVLGYTPSESSATENIRCIKLNATRYTRTSAGFSSDSVSSNVACFEVDANERIVDFYQGSANADSAWNDDESGVRLASFPGYLGIYFTAKDEFENGGFTHSYTGEVGSVIPVQYAKNSTSWSEFQASVKEAFSKKLDFNAATGEFYGDSSNSVCATYVPVGMANNDSASCYEWYTTLIVDDVSASSVPVTDYTLDANSATASSVVRRILRSGYRSFSPEEIASLYLDYMGQYTNWICGINNGSASDVGFTGSVKLFKNGVVEDCNYVRKPNSELPSQYLDKDGNLIVYGVDESGYFGTKVGIDSDIVPTLNRLLAENSLINLSEVQPISGSGGIPNEITGGGYDSADCYEAGVEGASWLLCPAIYNISSTTDGIDALLSGMLSIDEDLYGTTTADGQETATKQTWNYARDISNVVVIIVLLVVVFSQLTGFGIDNYGVKRILPRLIVIAVLLNLSFFVCQIAIDISNIVGAGLSNFLEGIGMNIYGGYSVGEFVTTIVGDLLAVAAGAGAASGVLVTALTIAIAGAGPMIVISLILSLLVALVAVLFFFLMLGARTVIVIICVAFAPLAFVCYILPNTQNVFKRWWNIFKTALVIYPICGALYGLSFIIRGMVFVQDGKVHPIMALIAIFAPYLPFFVLPTLLRGALSAIGSIGSTISSFGGSVRNGISSANRHVRETGAYRSETELQRRGMTRWRAGIDASGRPVDPSQMSRFGRLFRGGNHGIAQSRAQYVKDIIATGAEENMVGEGVNSAIAEAQAKVDAGNVASAQSLIEMNRAQLNNGGYVNSNNASQVGQYHREALARYNYAHNDAERAQALAQVRAAQNILMRTDAGRAQVIGNFGQAVTSGQTGGLRSAASHIMDGYGDRLKSVNRGGHALALDLSTAVTGEDFSRIASRVNGGAPNAYVASGTDSYDASSLVGADDAALDGLISALNGGYMSQKQISDITSTASSAIAMKENGKLAIKPKVEARVRTIASFAGSSGDINPEQPAEEAIQPVRNTAQNGMSSFEEIYNRGSNNLRDNGSWSNVNASSEPDSGSGGDEAPNQDGSTSR